MPYPISPGEGEGSSLQAIRLRLLVFVNKRLKASN